MNLETISEMTNNLEAAVALADRHNFNALDAAQQLRARHDALTVVAQKIREGHAPTEVLADLDNIVQWCPAASNIHDWLQEVKDMREQNARGFAELREQIEKAKDVERTRVTHGGS